MTFQKIDIFKISGEFEETGTVQRNPAKLQQRKHVGVLCACGSNYVILMLFDALRFIVLLFQVFSWKIENCIPPATPEPLCKPAIILGGEICFSMRLMEDMFVCNALKYFRILNILAKFSDRKKFSGSRTMLKVRKFPEGQPRMKNWRRVLRIMKRVVFLVRLRQQLCNFDAF